MNEVDERRKHKTRANVDQLLDRYGLLRLPRRPVSRRRILGVAVLLTGVALITLG